MIEETVVPRAIPVQTITAQETFWTEAATISPSSGTSPEPAAKRSSRASIPRPRRTESHATRRRVATRREPPAVALVWVASVACLLGMLESALLAISCPFVRRGEAIVYESNTPFKQNKRKP